MPLSLVYGQPEAWPVTVIPLAVNVVQYPPPTGHRCFMLGQAIRRAVEQFDENLNVQIWGTGGMSHQLQGPRAGFINTPWDSAFMDRLIKDPDGLSHAEAPRVRARSRRRGHRAGDVADHARCARPEAEELYRFYHVPGSNTAVGHLVLQSVETPA